MEKSLSEYNVFWKNKLESILLCLLTNFVIKKREFTELAEPSTCKIFLISFIFLNAYICSFKPCSIIEVVQPKWHIVNQKDKTKS